MWCSTCRTDVSVRTTGHAGGLLCSQCGHDLLAASKPTDAIRQAREILERWNSSDLFERISRTESLDSLQTRLDSNKKPTQHSSSLTKTLDFGPPENVVSDAGPSIPLTILKAPLTAEVLASISPKYFRDSEETTTLAEDAQTAVNSAQQVSAPEELTDSSSSSQVSDDLPDDVTGSVHSDIATTAASSGPDPLAIPQQCDDESVGRECTEESEESSGVSDGLPSASATYQSTEDRALEFSDESEDTDTAESPEIDREEILSVVTDTAAPVTTHGITSELQRVYDLALAQEARLLADEQNRAALSAGHILPDSGENRFAEENEAPEASSDPLTAADEATAADSTQAEERIYPTIMDIREESALSPTKPAELAKVNEHPLGAVPTKITRSPMRRPLLHRRFQMERPATTSSTGSENVNRKLRVDQPGGTDNAPEAAQQAADFIASSVAPETKIVSNASKPGRRFRIDGPESVDTVTGTDGRRARTQTLPKHRYIDDAHESSLRGPHFEITAPRRSNLTSVTGQFLAYLGVLGLTVGTAMVIYGHFGGYSEYTPTGWLVTTVAQMLLFLGVINLVSGGIEQNNEDVSRRINTLGEQLIRIEQVTTDVLRGPKLSPRLYDDPNAEVEESARETADIHRD